MSDFTSPFVHLQAALTADDVDFLKNACKLSLEVERIPCYGLLNSLDAPTFQKIKAALESRFGAHLHYLNDFYLYTDSSFKTDWHVDTELFAFDRAVNAWILLSPDDVDDPLGFIDGINAPSTSVFHSVRAEQDECIFGNYCTGESLARAQETIESEHLHTPHIRLGDILAFDPGRFHRTNVTTPKHAISIKFVVEGANGFLSPTQVDSYFWPEVDVFNRLVQSAHSWDDVLARLRHLLKNETDRKHLTAGFYPEQFELYRKMALSL